MTSKPEREHRFRMNNMLYAVYFLIFLVPLLVVLGAVGMGWYQASKSEAYRRLQAAEWSKLSATCRNTEAQLKRVVGDLGFLATATEVSLEHATDDEMVREQLSSVYSMFSTYSMCYDQIQFLMPDGWEKVRVEVGENGVEITPDNKLETNKGRYFFEEGLSQPRGGIYVSPVEHDPDVVGSRKQSRPTIRFCTPIYVKDNLKGLLQVRFLGQPLIDNLTQYNNATVSTIYLLNTSGHSLYPASSDVDSNVMDASAKAVAFKSRHPAYWQAITGKDSGQEMINEDLLTFRMVNPLYNVDGKSFHPRDSWVVASVVPKDSRFKEYSKTQAFILKVGLIPLILSVLFACALTARQYSNDKWGRAVSVSANDVWEPNDNYP